MAAFGKRFNNFLDWSNGGKGPSPLTVDVAIGFRTQIHLSEIRPFCVVNLVLKVTLL